MPQKCVATDDPPTSTTLTDTTPVHATLASFEPPKPITFTTKEVEHFRHTSWKQLTSGAENLLNICERLRLFSSHLL